MSPQTVTLTDLLRKSGDVLPMLSHGGIMVTRRDGEDFFMLQRPQWEAVSSIWRVLSSTCLAMWDDPVGRPRAHVADGGLPWLSLLSQEDRMECLRDVTGALTGALETGDLSAVVDVLAEWKATALATWDEKRNRKRAGYQEDEPVESVGS